MLCRWVYLARAHKKNRAICLFTCRIPAFLHRWGLILRRDTTVGNTDISVTRDPRYTLNGRPQSCHFLVLHCTYHNSLIMVCGIYQLQNACLASTKAPWKGLFRNILIDAAWPRLVETSACIFLSVMAARCPCRASRKPWARQLPLLTMQLAHDHYRYALKALCSCMSICSSD